MLYHIIYNDKVIAGTVHFPKPQVNHLKAWMILYYSEAKLEKTLDIVRKTMQKVLLTKNSKKLEKMLDISGVFWYSNKAV